MEQFDILIVGAGAAGISAAKAAAELGCGSILLADCKTNMGGVLLQCTHRGFGPDLTGPEYAEKLLLDFPEAVTFLPGTTVLKITENRTATLSRCGFGAKMIRFHQLILATGCLEVPIGALPIAGTRPKGVYTAGQIQEQMNLYDFTPEEPVVILGSGDLGLIMAKQLAEAGIKIAALVEQKPVCGGLTRNQRCLSEHSIPLRCNTTIIEVCGEKQLEGVVLSDQTHIPCRTLLIAAGLRPDRTLLHGLHTPDWLHLCGNCSTVHPMVEGVISEGKQAGITAYEQVRGSL